MVLVGHFMHHCSSKFNLNLWVRSVVSTASVSLPGPSFRAPKPQFPIQILFVKDSTVVYSARPSRPKIRTFMKSVRNMQASAVAPKDCYLFLPWTFWATPDSAGCTLLPGAGQEWGSQQSVATVAKPLAMPWGCCQEGRPSGAQQRGECGSRTRKKWFFSHRLGGRRLSKGFGGNPGWENHNGWLTSTTIDMWAYLHLLEFGIMKAMLFQKTPSNSWQKPPGNYTRSNFRMRWSLYYLLVA